MMVSLGRPISRRPPPPASAIAALARQLGCSVLARVYAARGVRPNELGYPTDRLLAPDTLSGMHTATALTARVLTGGGRLLVVADYDADGATGCAVAVRGLRVLGAGTVDYLVPSRFTSGYGLSIEVAHAAIASRPDLVITVDNGITSLDGIAQLRKSGIAVVVTDHHLPGQQLPDANAIVNPRLPGDPFPSKHLAGVGVMFYFLLALRARLRADGWFRAGRAEPNLARLLDLVALGTVADVVPLDYNNRVLVAHGLARLNAGGGQPGLRALLALDTTGEPITATELAFRAGPRLNAAGRMDDMSFGIECLLTDDPATAAKMAAQLDAFNRQRRAVEAQMQAEATAHMEALSAPLPPVLCLHSPDWHSGVVGIIAGRLRERYTRPAVAFAPAADGVWRGSARSLSGVHIRDALAAVATRHPGMIKKFGGHAMAAGLTLAHEHLTAFAAALGHAVLEQTGGVLPTDALLSDGSLDPALLTLDLAQRLHTAGPWGQGFAPPLFDDEFQLHETRVVGGDHLRLLLSHRSGGERVGAIAWRAATLCEHLGERVHIAYRPQVNTFRGERQLQLMVEALLPV
ncbi:single-stranded-DNA-specific exonuclease RecJ [Immundisolibacter sp.]|uniref:single-stranded-DNA-specific exonuclease RecJ n=1 Tax=Immundisolibacter sp. TaxID=1934948 RepID=UPI003564FB67